MTRFRRWFVPLAILLSGVIFILLGLKSEDEFPPVGGDQSISPPLIQESLTEVFREGVPEESAPAYSHDQYLKDLLARALWESEAAATRAARELREAMLEKVEGDSVAFLEKLYNLSTTKMEVFSSKDKHRAFIVDKIMSELNANRELEERLSAVVFQYFHDLERIAQELTIQSGLDIAEFPPVVLTMGDFSALVRDDLSASMTTFASSAKREGQTSAAIGTVSMGASLFLPTPFLIDLTVGFAVDTAIERYRDANTKLEAQLNHAMEDLADRICFGTAGRPGMYAAFLDISHYHNHRMSQLLVETRRNVEVPVYRIEPGHE